MDSLPQDFEHRLEQAKLEAVKELAYGASHEINNPLANISARAQTLLRDERDPERRRALEAIDQQALRAHEMISDLMLFARPPRLACAEFSPAALCHRLASEFHEEAQRRQIAWHTDLGDAPAQAWGDSVQWGVALHALIRNAFEAIGKQGSVTLRIDRSTEPGFAMRWLVADSGPGISPAVRERMFDPFFSGREAGRGLGFGLCKCWRIVTEHGGRIVVGASDQGGAAIGLLLPAGEKGAHRDA